MSTKTSSIFYENSVGKPGEEALHQDRNADVGELALKNA